MNNDRVIQCTSSVVEQILNNSVDSNFRINMIERMAKMRIEETFRNIPLFLFLGLVSAFGTVGNFLVLYVYGFRYRASNSRIFILCLSMVDLCTCVLGIPLDAVTIWDVYQFDTPWPCKMSRFLTIATSASSVLLLLLIAVDRFRKICRAFKWQLTNNHAKYLSIGAIFVGSFVYWPSLILKGLKSREISLGRNLTATRTTCSNEDRYSKSNFPLVHGLVLLVLFVVAFVIIVVLYTLIRQKVKSFAQNHEPACGRLRVMLRRLSDVRGTRTYNRRQQQTDVAIPLSTLNEISENNISNGNADNCSTDRRITAVSKKRPDQCLNVTETGTMSNVSTLPRGTGQDRKHLTRKTTSLMFIITVAFVLSFVPGLVIVLETPY